MTNGISIVTASSSINHLTDIDHRTSGFIFKPIKSNN